MQAPATAPPGEHIPALDGLRGVAILLVLMHQLNRIDPRGLPAVLVENFFDLGWIGVQLFFVLSGFLITGILLDSRCAPRPLRSFYARRALRIFPLYYSSLILFLLILPSLGLTPPGWADHQIWYWLYLSNWTQPYVAGSLPHFWSLAIEEQFYLVWPFVVLWVRSPAALIRLCIAVAAASLALRAAMVTAGLSYQAVYTFTTSRIDALLLGGAGAALLRLPAGVPRWATSRNLWIAALSAGTAGFIATRGYRWNSPMGQTLGYSILALVFAAVILALVLERRPDGRSGLAARVLSTPAFRTIGLFSYGMYVLHKPIHDLVGKRVLDSMGLGGQLPLGPGVAYVVGGSAVVFAAGAASYWLLERHFLALKGRFPPGLRPPAR